MVRPGSQSVDAGRSAAGATESSRRGFLGTLTVLLGAIPIAGGLFVTLRTALAGAKSHKPDKLPLCKLSEVPADGILPKAISFHMRRGPAVESVARVVFVTRDPASGDVICMAGECTHLTCPVQHKTVTFQKDGADHTAPLACPCHGGKFSRTGEPVAGPPKRPLPRLKLQMPPTDQADGQIYLLEF